MACRCRNLILLPLLLQYRQNELFLNTPEPCREQQPAELVPGIPGEHHEHSPDRVRPFAHLAGGLAAARDRKAGAQGCDEEEEDVQQDEGEDEREEIQNRNS